MSRRGRLQAMKPHSQFLLTIPLPLAGSVCVNQLGSPALLVIWAWVPGRVGNAGQRRRGSALERPLNGRFRGAFPYFGLRFTKSSMSEADSQEHENIGLPLTASLPSTAYFRGKSG